MYLDDFKARLWMWGPFIGFAVALVLLLIFVVPSLLEPEVDNSGGVFPYGRPYQLTLPGELRRAYIAANGDESSIRELNSIRASGVLETGDERASFTSIKKRPWQSVLNLRFHTHELTFAVDGDTVWQRVQPRGKEPIVNLKSGEEARRIRQLGAFFDPVMMLFLLGKGTILGIREGNWEDQASVVLDFENEELALRSTAYIDPKTMFLLARVDALPDGGNRTLLYSDHRKVLSVIEPFVIETRVNGEFDNRVKINRIEYNVGAFSSTFEYPGPDEGVD